MLFQTILLLTLLAIAWMYILYPSFLFVVCKKKTLGRKRVEKEENNPFPRVSFIIATFNEGSIIDRRIKNLLNQDYPADKLQIIVVDSGSTDQTCENIEKKWMERVLLLRQKTREGKAKAINLALRKAEGDIAILTDAPTLFERDVTRLVVSNFADPRIGCVTGKYIPFGNEKIGEIEKVFWNFKNALRTLEGKADSTSYTSGELCAFRRSLLGCVDEDAIADDVNIALKIRKRGFKTICDPRAIFFEKAPEGTREYFTQKVRRALGGIKETLRFRNIFLNTDYGLFGLIIFPTRLLHTILQPFLLMFFSSFCIIQALDVVSGFASSLTYATFLAVISIFGIFMVLRPKLVVNSLKSFVLSQIVLLIAVFKFMFGIYDVRWEKAESTRRTTSNPKNA